MADEVRRVEYCHVMVKDQAGTAAEVLRALRDAGVNLLAFTAFPEGRGKSQVDLVTADLDGVKRVARDRRWKLSPVKRAFLVQGEDRVGAVAGVLGKLADAKVNLTAANAVSAGGGRYGLLFWVKSQAYARAAKALGV